jgi:hypothetical protein
MFIAIGKVSRHIPTTGDFHGLLTLCTSTITSDVYCIAEKLLKVTIETNNQSPFEIKGTH